MGTSTALPSSSSSPNCTPSVIPTKAPLAKATFPSTSSSSSSLNKGNDRITDTQLNKPSRARIENTRHQHEAIPISYSPARTLKGIYGHHPSLSPRSTFKRKAPSSPVQIHRSPQVKQVSSAKTTLSRRPSVPLQRHTEDSREPKSCSSKRVKEDDIFSASVSGSVSSTGEESHLLSSPLLANEDEDDDYDDGYGSDTFELHTPQNEGNKQRRSRLSNNGKNWEEQERRNRLERKENRQVSENDSRGRVVLNDPVRKKTDRECMKAISCAQCEEFYRVAGNMYRTAEEGTLCDHVSRHRTNDTRLDMTPPGYWSPMTLSCGPSQSLASATGGNSP